MENYYILSCEKGFWSLTGGCHFREGFDWENFGVLLMGTGCLLVLVIHGGLIV